MWLPPLPRAAAGTEPLGTGAAVVGDGTVADARAAAQRVCSQMLLLGGTLDLSNNIVGNRTADVKHVAYNRTLGAGVAAKKVQTRRSTAHAARLHAAAAPLSMAASTRGAAAHHASAHRLRVLPYGTIRRRWGSA